MWKIKIVSIVQPFFITLFIATMLIIENVAWDICIHPRNEHSEKFKRKYGTYAHVLGRLQLSLSNDSHR